MLTSLLNTKNSILFDVIAQAWLESGAQSFSIWENGQPIARWPQYSIPEGEYTIAQVKNGLRAELRITGLSGNLSRLRLENDARLLGVIAPMARDLLGVTNELIETRDQLLALYNLSLSSRVNLDLVIGLDALAKSIARLGRSEIAFVVMRHFSAVPDLTIANNSIEASLFSAQFPIPIFGEEALKGLLDQISDKEYLLINRSNKNLSQWEGVNNLLMVPIQIQGTMGAALGLVNRITGEFMSPDIKLAKAISAYASVNIENLIMIQSQVELTRLQTEMDLSRQVQLSLLPKEPPCLPSLDIWAATRPARHVGGDFYDFIQSYENPFTFVVGDLAGKGFPAALLMSMTRTVIRTEMHGKASPELILSGTNRELFEDLNRLNSFATLFIGQYFPTSREIRYANAGHSPVIYCPAAGKARILYAENEPVGIFPDGQSKAQVIALQTGDVLIVGSDGLPDARNEKLEFFGYDRLVNLIERVAHYPAKEIVQAIFDTITGFQNSCSPSDDQTLVVIKCTERQNW